MTERITVNAHIPSAWEQQFRKLNEWEQFHLNEMGINSFEKLKETIEDHIQEGTVSGEPYGITENCCDTCLRIAEKLGMLKLVCANCGEIITRINTSQQISLEYNYHTGKWERDIEDTLESFQCPNCHEELDDDDLNILDVPNELR